MTNIFDEKNKVTGAFWKYEKIGDEVEGTYVGKNQKPDNYKPGEKQWIYELLTKNGDVVLVGGKPGIDLQMKHIRFGQIVGMRFIEERPNSNPAFDPTKIIQIFADPKIVDEDWLKANETMPEAEQEGEETYVEEGSPIDEAIESLANDPGNKDSVLLEEINELAMDKLKITEDKVQKTVSVMTDIAFLPSNYPEIIKELKKL